MKDNSLWMHWFGRVLWRINPCRLLNAKSFHIYILNIYDLETQFVENIFKRLNGFNYCYQTLIIQFHTNNCFGNSKVVTCIYHHHHLVVPSARISLTLSRHLSLSFIAFGRSSTLYPVSSQSWCMQVARRQLHQNASTIIEQVQEAAPHKAAAVPPPTTHHENYPN